MSRSNVGLLVLLAKLGPKLLPILAKLQDVLMTTLKSLFGIKSAGIVGSVGLYTYLMTWQMGLSIVVFIAIHEYGHLWAMKRCDIRTRGMFFIPGFGAVALADERFKSARNEAYIALMGPIFGLIGFVLPMLCLYWKTKDPLWAAIASFMTFINLINLLPIHPLDGGRVLKAVAYSEKLTRSILIVLVISFTMTVLGAIAGFVLLVYMAILGFLELADDFGIRKYLPSLFLSLGRICGGTFFGYLIYWLVTQFGQYAWWQLLSGVIGVFFGLAIAYCDVMENVVRERVHVLLYPLVILLDIRQGRREIRGLKAHHVQPIENYDPMGAGGKVGYSLGYTSLVLVHATLIFLLSRVPGSEIAREFLR